MKDFSIQPHQGYLNTTFVFSNEGKSKVTLSVEPYAIPPIEIESGGSVSMKFPAGTHHFHSEYGEETIVVEDAYRFGGSKLKYAYLTPHGSNAILVMLDRMYIYDYIKDTMWTENGLVPEEIEAAAPGFILLKSPSCRIEDENTLNVHLYSLFDIRKKEILFNFEESIYYSESCLVYRKKMGDAQVIVYYYESNELIELPAKDCVVDTENNILYYFHPKRNVIWGLQLDGNTKTPQQQIVYQPYQGEQFIQFEGTHFAISQLYIVNLRDGKRTSISTWGRLAAVNGLSISDFDGPLSEMTQKESVNAVLREQYKGRF